MYTFTIVKIEAHPRNLYFIPKIINKIKHIYTDKYFIHYKSYIQDFIVTLSQSAHILIQPNQ